MIKVYHMTQGAREADPMSFVRTDDSKKPLEEFTHVADVDIPDERLADVFRITNHIEWDWRENSEVVFAIEGPVRSTSVGDIIKKSDGTLWIVDSVGFKQLEGMDW